MTTNATRTYKGETIEECEMADWREHGGRWLVRRYEHGMVRFDSQTPHYRTLAEAREAIDAQHAYEAQAV